MKTCVALSLAALAVISVAQTRTAQLSVGDKAPALRVEAWVKGNPVKTFRPGQVYVVEFWATWCKPCLAAMPELSDLADATKGKVTVVAVNVWDRQSEAEKKAGTAHQKRIADFVKKNSNNMRFHVATDTANEFMAKNWLAAANRNGIPCSFIVDQKGRVAWIGHPGGMKDALQKVLKGQLNLRAEKKAFDTANIQAKKAATANEQLAAAAAKGDFAAFDRLFKASASDNMSRVMNALNTTGRKTPDFLMQYFDRNWDALSDVSPETWPMFVAMIVQNSKRKETQDLAFKRALEGYERTSPDMKAYASLALAQNYLRGGRKEEAKKWADRCESFLPTSMPSIKEDIRTQLADLRKKLVVS